MATSSFPVHCYVTYIISTAKLCHLFYFTLLNSIVISIVQLQQPQPPVLSAKCPNSSLNNTSQTHAKAKHNFLNFLFCQLHYAVATSLHRVP